VDPFRYLQAKWIYGYHQPMTALTRLELQRGSLLLLLGSGLGKTAMMIAERIKCRVIGADLVSAFVDRANRRAQEVGLSDQVRFLTVTAEQPYLDVGADAIFFECILSFLKDPRDTLAYYARKARRATKIGVLEPTLSSAVNFEHVTASLKEIFGEAANFREGESWSRIFKEAGLVEIEAVRRPLGLKRKFFDDLREEPLGTLVDLSKTLYKVYTDSEAKKSMRLFRRFFKHSQEVACGRYTLQVAR
jgi:SAM-dependent methyltransferase